MARRDEPSLEFQANEAGEEEGLGHAGMETFRDAPYASLGREHGQNSLDAKAKDPVIVAIDLIDVAAKDYPDHGALKEAIESCLSTARDNKTRHFFRVARSKLEENSLRVLRIADFNTLGLRGPSRPGTPFHALLKGAGVSEGKAETSGGSFGIGKNAAFAASDLQTVFYSTVYQEEDGSKSFLTQGKSVLVSHVDANRKARRATGYWGLENFQPICNPSSVPEWLRRSEIGTSVFIVAFREKEHWASRIAAAILQNFFGAIHDGAIQFLIDNGRIRIDRETLPALFADQEVRNGAELESRLEDFESACFMYRCLVADEAVERTLELPELGRVSVRILMADGLPKRVLLLRNGMWITDTLQHFGEKFQRFPMYREFVAVVQCLDSDGNALLKQLESPRHDSLSAERVPDPGLRKRANRAMRALAKSIREAIRECAKPDPSERTAIDELAEFFSDTHLRDDPPMPATDRNPERMTYTITPARNRTRNSIGQQAGGNSGGGGGSSGRRSGGKGGQGQMEGPGRGGSGSLGGQSVALLEPRNTLDARQGEQERTIFFTPAESGYADLQIFASGIESSEKLKVIHSDIGEVRPEAIRILLEEGKRTKIKVSFDEPYSGPIELIATSATSPSHT